MEQQRQGGGNRGGAVRAGSQGWDAGRVRALRYHLRMSQKELADELGARQQTVSEWETGRYRPRGTSARLLSIIAEGAGFQYAVGKGQSEMGDEAGGVGGRRR